MTRIPRFIASALFCIGGLFLAPSSVPKAEAGPIFGFPIFFFPVADCGTIGAVGTVDINGNVEVECLVWDADSGGRYTFAGIDDYNIGDRVFVSGQACTICLTTCPATPLLNSTDEPCDE